MPIPKATISIRITPNATRNEIVSFTDDILRIRIAAPPLKGRANRELLGFLCRLLAVSKDRVSIVKGHTTRNKIIAIDGMDKDSALGLLLTNQGT